ncbi:hypothetical protein WJX74_005180 [Apatococcus lobatus]|uniref:DIS3-like exonuclease 1 n=1 Tax=Apatococcus lobatus TaxID=904363 RepID=A0AAW1RKF7_9CHLO
MSEVEQARSGKRWHEYRLRRQGPSITDAGREAYLRTDISCGSDFCRSCSSSRSNRLIKAAHYAVPDRQTLTDLLELLELPEFQNVILLNSIVKPVTQSRNLRLNTRIRALYTDARRRCLLFDDLHHDDIAEPGPAAVNSFAVLVKAAQWYHGHLENQVPIVIISDALIRDLGVATEPPATPCKGQPAASTPSGPHSPLSQSHSSVALDASPGTPGALAQTVLDNAAQTQPQQPSEESALSVSALSSRQQSHASSEAPASEIDILADLLGAAASDKQPAASTSHSATDTSSRGTHSTGSTQRRLSANLLPNRKPATPKPESQLPDHASSGHILDELLAAAGGSRGSQSPAMPAAKFESQPTQAGIDLQDDDDAILEELLSGQPQASTRQQPQPFSSLKDSMDVQSSSSSSSHIGIGKGMIGNDMEQSQQHARQVSCNDAHSKPVSASRRLNLGQADGAKFSHGSQPQSAARPQPRSRPQPQRQICASPSRGPNQKYATPSQPQEDEASQAVHDVKGVIDLGGVLVMTAAAYVAHYHTGNAVMTDLLDSLTQAGKLQQQPRTSPSPSKHAAYPAHVRPSTVETAISDGSLLQGTYRASRVPGEFGVVRAGTTAISIMSRAAANRALQGDTVAVRLLKHEQWDGTIPRTLLQDDDVMPTNTGPAPDASPHESSAAAVDTQAGGRRQPQGEVMAILQRSPQDIVACMCEPDERSLREGTSRTGSMYAALCLPMDRSYPQLRISSRRLPDLLGQRFVVRIDDWPATSTFPNAHLVRVLGPLNDLRTEGEAVLVNNAISHPPFSAAALGELPQVLDPRSWQIPAEEVLERRDLRSDDYLICSVDPPGCTDVDDALSVRFLGPDIIELGVHIADVSHFVHQGGCLDREAEARSTSVYLPDRRLDMLPRLLSEHLCSLNSNVDRLSVSVIWTLDMSFNLKQVWMGRTIIRSKHKLTYQEAQNLVDGVPVEAGVGGDEVGRAALKQNLQALCDFADHLRQGRLENGAMELESAELQFETSAEGEARGVKTKQELPMMRTVAELMIHANSTVAARIHAAFPRAALLRRHPPPRPEAFAEVEELCKAGGHPLDTSTPATLSKSLAAACTASADPSIASLVKSLATRAMSEAEYFSTGDVRPGGGGQGHFGLALAEYTHFTSPIRRYADIIVHRQLITALSLSSPPDEDFAGPRIEGGRLGRGMCVGTAPLSPEPQHRGLVHTADHVNGRHRAAKKAQRDCQALHLLLLLHREPHVEPALVYAILPQQLFVFVPQFHIRGAIRLTDKAGLVIPPANGVDDPQLAADAFGTAARRILQLQQDGDGSCSIINHESGTEVARFRPMQRIWVELGADGSRAHGPTLQMRLVSEAHPLVRAQAEQIFLAARGNQQAVGTAKGDAQDIKRMQEALATSGLLEQHKKAVAEGTAKPYPIARSMLTQAQQKQQAQELARVQASSQQQPPSTSTSHAPVLPGSRTPAGSPADPLQHLQASGGHSTVEHQEQAAHGSMSGASHNPAAEHHGEESDGDMHGNRDIPAAEAMAEHKTGRRRSAQHAGSIAAAIADAWSLSEQQVSDSHRLAETQLPQQLSAGSAGRAVARAGVSAGLTRRLHGSSAEQQDCNSVTSVGVDGSLQGLKPVRLEQRCASLAGFLVHGGDDRNSVMHMIPVEQQ